MLIILWITRWINEKMKFKIHQINSKRARWPSYIPAFCRQRWDSQNKLTSETTWIGKLWVQGRDPASTCKIKNDQRRYPMSSCSPNTNVGIYACPTAHTHGLINIGPCICICVCTQRQINKQTDKTIVSIAQLEGHLMKLPRVEQQTLKEVLLITLGTSRTRRG